MKTYVLKPLYNEIVSRPDWPEIKKRMQESYGTQWELVPINYEASLHPAPPYPTEKQNSLEEKEERITT